MVFIPLFHIWLKFMKGLTSSSGENWVTDKKKDKWEWTNNRQIDDVTA